MEGFINNIKQHINDKKEENEKLSEALYFLSNYYDKKRLIIVGLNDTNGITYLHQSLQKSLLEVIKAYFKDYKIKDTYIDAFNSVINQPEYIDYMLNHNVTLNDIFENGADIDAALK